MTVYLDRSQLTNFPYSSPNRDRNGSPKTGVYGGVLRGRLSSQFEKRHEREAVERLLGSRALRTRAFPFEISETLVQRGWDENTSLLTAQMMLLASQIKSLGIADSGGTNVMLFLPDNASALFADLADTYSEDLSQAVNEAARELAKKTKNSKKKADGSKDTDEEEDTSEEEDKDRTAITAKYAKKLPKGLRDSVLGILRSRNASVAAYGRMLADEAGSSVEAAIQTAHSLSTHPTATQMDSFTAVDDLLAAAKDGPRAGHMGDQRYNSAIYYGYSVLNVTELLANLGGDTETTYEVIDAFLRAPFLHKGGGKHTSTAPHTVPHVVYASVRTDRPVNLVGAYANPIPSTQNGYLDPSLDALDTHAGAHHRLLGTKQIAGHSYTGLTDREFENLGQHQESVEDFVQYTLDTIRQVIQ